MQKNSAPESDGELSPSTLKETYPVSGKNLSTLLPWITLLLSLAATVIAWKAEVNNSQRALQEGFDRMASQAKSAIQRRLTRVELALLGAKGFVETSGGVTRKQWREYVGALKIEEAFPGIQGIGFAVRVPAEDKAEHEEKIRNEGFPKYTITPPGARAEYYPIIYLEPFDWRNQRSFGYDMFSEPVRREAMERSRRQGVTTISGKVILVQETEKDRQNGFLMYVPVYAKSSSTATQAERERTHIGFAYAPFRMNNFMKGALEGERHWIANPDWLDIEINDGRELKDEALLFDSDPEHIHQPGEMASVMPIEVYGHVWTLRCNPKPAFIRVMYKGKPEMVLIGGLLFSLLIFGITWSLANTKKHAETLARRMSDDLRRSMNDVRALLDSAQESMFLMEVGGELISLNETAARRFGKTPDEMVGKNIYDFMPPELATVRKEREAEAVTNRSALTIEDERSGRVIRTTLWPVVDNATGEVARVAGFSMDETERKKAEKALRKTRQLLDSIVENIPAMVFLKRASDLRFELFNQAGEKLLGYSRNDLIGKCDYDFFPKEQGDFFTTADRKALASKEITDIPEEPIKMASGETRYLHTWKIALRDEAGTPSHLLGISLDITDSKRMEKEIRESNEVLERIFETAHFHVVLLDPEFNFVRVNKAYADVCGFAPEYFAGKNHFDLYPSQELESKFRRVVETGVPYTVYSRPFEFPDQPELGVTYWDLAVYPVKGASGEVEGILFTLMEVTERKRAEELLKQSEEKYRMLVDEMTDGFFITDEMGVIKFSNKAHAKMLGYKDVDELIDKSVIEHIQPFAREKIINSFNNLDTEELPEILEVPILKKDGRAAIFEVRPVVVIKEGRAVGTRGVVRDITERNRMEEKLKNSELWLQSIYNSLDDAVLVVTPDRKLMNVNRAAKLIFGYSEEELRSLSTEILHVDHEHYVEFGRRMQEAFNEGRVTSFEYELKRKNGEIFPTEHSVSLLKDNDGKTLGIVGVTRDITERKRAEEQLRIAKEQAEAATKLKDKFVSIVAHDLRSPFTAILGLMEILRNDQNTPLSASHKEIVSLILESGKTQVRMIDNLLTLSRLQADKIIPQKRFLDAWGLVQSAIDPLIHLTRQKDVGITNQVPHNAWLYADPDLFHGVIHNLLSNAIKFCRKGDSVTVFQPAGLPAALAVRDTGVGINSSILPHLFSSEVKTTTHGTLGERGSGLGLPLSFNIMTAHGGSISAENQPEGGSSFTLTLPYVQPLILLVDDEEIARTILNHSLIGLNANVIGAGSVDEAVELIRRNRPNLVIADIQMPGKNGFDLLTWITKNAKGLPVMMLTTDSSMATREEAFRLGANDFVTKPVNKNDLIPRARSLILSAPS